MKASIIIPVFNVNQFIERCLLSALSQSYQDIEIILVDDCGNDDSMKIASNLIYNHVRGSVSKIVKHERNQGLSVARNTGINIATGEYVYFLDSDDEISPDCIELFMAIALKNKPNFVVADYQTRGTSKIYPPLNLEEGYINSGEQILSAYLQGNWYMMAWNKLVNKSFLISNNLFFKKGIVHEDQLWSFMLACKAKSVSVIKKKVYTYYIRSDSITRNPSLHNFQSLTEIIVSMIEFIKEDNKLINDKDIYNYIEGLKSAFFAFILESETNNDFKYSSYKKIRESNYIKVKFPFANFNMIWASTIRNVHYVLPAYLGFIYFSKFLFIKNKLQQYNKNLSKI